jgi:hypothetical protein
MKRKKHFCRNSYVERRKAPEAFILSSEQNNRWFTDYLLQLNITFQVLLHKQKFKSKLQNEKLKVSLTK